MQGRNFQRGEQTNSLLTGRKGQPRTEEIFFWQSKVVGGRLRHTQLMVTH